MEGNGYDFSCAREDGRSGEGNGEAERNVTSHVPLPIYMAIYKDDYANPHQTGVRGSIEVVLKRHSRTADVRMEISPSLGKPPCMPQGIAPACEPPPPPPHSPSSVSRVGF
ncbi:hypothetical protein D5086_016960 [Populus alba]|uniref:Uncharacterized protein n=1 Tax=Populus alba TaxID=43335 RepID=A0ACC4BVH0_POPAL